MSHENIEHKNNRDNVPADLLDYLDFAARLRRSYEIIEKIKPK